MSGIFRHAAFGLLMFMVVGVGTERVEAATTMQMNLPPSAQALLDRARQANPTRYQFAIDRGASITATPDGRSFLLSWFPTTRKNGRTMIVTLHGSSSWAFDEFQLWYDVAQRHGHGIIALQWWLANDAAPNDYYAPDAVYRFTPTKDGTLTVQLTGTDFPATAYAVTNCADIKDTCLSSVAPLPGGGKVMLNLMRAG